MLTIKVLNVSVAAATLGASLQKLGAFPAPLEREFLQKQDRGEKKYYIKITDLKNFGDDIPSLVDAIFIALDSGHAESDINRFIQIKTMILAAANNGECIDRVWLNNMVRACPLMAEHEKTTYDDSLPEPLLSATKT